MWDFAIIGAGPAGCAAALELRRAGASVLLIEKAAFPRDKLCGEFLSPEVAGSLEALGCGARFRRARPEPIARAVAVTPSGARVEFPFPTTAWGLSRLRFDHLLAEAAREAGAELVEKAEVAEAGREVLTRDGRRFRAGAVLLAAGRHSLLQPMPRASRAWFGFKAHYEGDCAGRVELYFFRGGYCGLAPVEGGRVNVCCLVEKSLLADRAAEQLLADVPAVRERLAGMRRLEAFLHAGPVAMGWRKPPAGLMPAGDAALFVDPFTGDGIAVALHTGWLAARHALEGVPAFPERIEAYLEELRRRFGRQMRASGLLRAAAQASWLEAPLLGLFSSAAVRRAAYRLTRAR